jgi:hypothetical protein
MKLPRLFLTVSACIITGFLILPDYLFGPQAQSATPTPGNLPLCLKSDLNRDGIVDRNDLSILRDNFFMTAPSEPRADINADGIVDITDYSNLSADYDISVFTPCQ